MRFKLLVKAARADFLPASLVPFFTGMAYAVNRGFPLSWPKLLLGFSGVAAAHLSANLLNDYYDYKSGADSQTAKVSPFFGGSRAIQQGIFSEKEVFRFSLWFLFIAFLSGMGILVITQNPLFLVLMLAGGVLAVSYTAPPLRLAYNRWGEIDIFLLFGSGLVLSSFYLFSGEFTFGAFLISLPSSFLIAAVIICNEVPDFAADIKVNKRNLLSICGIKKGYLIYGLMILVSFFTLLLNIRYKILPRYAAAIGLVYILGLLAFANLKTGRADIKKLIEASWWTIEQHALTGIMTIVILLIS